MSLQKTVTGLILALGLSACTDSTPTENYQEKLMTIEQRERSEPSTFLKAEGTYHKNLFGDKLNVKGRIKNGATVITYKDVVVRITYFSETKKELGKIEHTIPDFFPPQSEKPYEVKIENNKDVNSIGWKVIAATPQ